jgi:hypothetical protein
MLNTLRFPRDAWPTILCDTKSNDRPSLSHNPHFRKCGGRDQFE